MFTPEELKEIIRGGEGIRVEFKRSVPSKVKELTEEVCGFANAVGGYIFIGVDDNNVIVGEDINNSKRAAIEGSISEISPTVNYNLYNANIEGKSVWVIEVFMGKANPYVFSGSIYVRDGAVCRKVTRVDDMRCFFQDNNQIYFDSAPMPKVNLMSELDEFTFGSFRQMVGLSGDVDNKQILENLQLFTDDGFVKSGGVLFFDASPEKYFPHAMVHCVSFKGIDKYYILDDKMFGGTLFNQYNSTIQWLQSKLQVAYSINTAGAHEEIWEIPVPVFREAVLNALLHRSYYEQGANITVELYDDRVEISNPGGLLPAVANHFGRRSFSRNPIVFSLFTRMHLVEHIGSGIPRMINEMIKVGLPEPEFETKDMFSVTLYRPIATINKGVNISQTLTDRQVNVMNIIKENPNITMDEAGQLMNLGRTTIYQTLKELKQMGLVCFTGRKSSGTWMVCEEPFKWKLK